MVKVRRKKVYRMKRVNKRRNRWKFILRRIVVFSLLVTFFISLKYILSKKNDFISVDSINNYIKYVDDFSERRGQLNWQEVAAIDSVKNVDFNNINKKKIDVICKEFYDKDGKIKDFDEVLTEQDFTDKEKRKAKKNLNHLSDISLRSMEHHNKEKDKFIESMRKISIDNYKKNGILPSVAISQAILESNWGKSELSAKYNNYFGIKADAGWKGRVVNYSTKENYDDVIDADFRAYDSMGDSVDDFGKFLNENRRYKENGLFDGKNYIEQAQALENAGYSTKKNDKGEAIYADLLIKLIRDNNLMLIDNEAFKS